MKKPVPETAPGGTSGATKETRLGGLSNFFMMADKECNDCCMFDNTMVH